MRPTSHVVLCTSLIGLLTFAWSAVRISEQPSSEFKIFSDRVSRLSGELIKARAILWCGERLGSAGGEIVAYRFSDCVGSFVTMGRGQVAPQVSELSPDKFRELLADARDTVEQRLLAYVCDRIRLLFESPNRGKTCAGEEELKSDLFFELVPDHTSKVPKIVMKIYGSSIELSARQKDYWELHRISFQLVENDITQHASLVVGLFDSRSEKNRDAANSKGMRFKDRMDPSTDAELNDFARRIAEAVY